MVMGVSKRKNVVESSESSKPEMASSLLTSQEEINFPRGGANALTPIEYRQIANQAANDVLFNEKTTQMEIDAGPVKKKQKSDRAKSKKSKTESKDGDKKPERKPIDELNYKKLIVGGSILGCISQIRQPDLELVVSLPHQLHGVVRITEISQTLTSKIEAMAEEEEDEDEDEDMDEDPSDSSKAVPDLNELFRVGQWVRCKVISVPGSFDDVATKKQVELTIDPQKVNGDVAVVDITSGLSLGATVESIEDHGYVLSVGIEGLTGFCSKADAAAYVEKYQPNRPIIPGQYVECVVTKMASNKRVVNVTLDPARLGKTKVSSAYSKMTSIQPGHLVEGVVDTIQLNGIVVNFMGFYNATVDMTHIPTERYSKLKVGGKVTIRLLFCLYNPDRKMIGASMLPHVLALDSPSLGTLAAENTLVSDVFPFGSFVDKVTVTRVSPLGAYMSLEGTDQLTGFVHISRIDDTRIEALSPVEGKFKIGTTHRARVLGYSPVEGALLLTTQPSVLEQKYMRASDVQLGSIVEGVVKKFTVSGLVISLSDKVTAFVPKIQLSDVTLTHPELKFKPGAKVKGRVMKVDVQRPQIIVTLRKSLMKTLLPIITDANAVEPGMTTHATVVLIPGNNRGCVVGFYNDLTAFLPIKEISEDHVSKVEDMLQVGQVVKVWIQSVDHDTGKMVVSMINKDAKAKKAAMDALEEQELASNQWVTAQIKGVLASQINLALPKGRIGRVHISMAFKDFADIKDGNDPLSQFSNKVGNSIKVNIIGVRDNKTQTYLPPSASSSQDKASAIECSLVAPEQRTVNEIRNTKAGERYLGFVTEVKAHQLKISIGPHTWGTVSDNYMSSNADVCNNPAGHFVKGQVVQVAVLAGNESGKNLKLAIVDSDDQVPCYDISSLEQGSIVNAKVVRYDTKRGLFARVSPTIAGFVHPTDLSDDYVDSPANFKEPNNIVRCMVVGMSTDESQRRIDLSMRASRLSPGSPVVDPEITSAADLAQDQVIRGYVVNIADGGVYIALGRQINARVKIANLSDAFVKEWRNLYKLGSLVRTKVLATDIQTNKIEATLKRSQVDGVSAHQNEKAADAEHAMSEDDDSDANGESDSDAPEESEEEEEDEAEDKVLPLSAMEVDDEPTDALNVGAFDWTGETAMDTDSEQKEESDDEEETKDDAKQAKKNNRKDIVDRTAELSSAAPQNVTDYERLLVGSPDSSYLWINYMAFQLQLSDIDKARDIGERALKRISFREIQEKMNVWVALLNLENTYGTEETLDEAFQRALHYGDPMRLYLQLANIYERSNKIDKAKEHWEATVRAFNSSPEVWIQFGQFCMRQNDMERARELLPSSLKTLPQHEHIAMIMKFAQLEFKHGEPERGRTIFEGLMSNHPKRLDLWNVYIDMEVRAGAQDAIRRLFERVTSMKFSSKKMKSLFKKWLQYEKAHGTEEDVEHVKDKTLAYVEATTA